MQRATRKWWQGLYCCVAILGLATGTLHISALLYLRWVDSHPSCIGQEQHSPDRRFLASANDCSRRDFLTGEFSAWHEFELSGQDLKRSLKSDPLPGYEFGRLSEQVIFWEADSSAVRFVITNTELRFATKPDSLQ